ncbi:hypothetical protein SAMN05444008_102431 [Cnuella takakiae]|uniref:Ppx/GppA phosphatase family protein n=1 Tax=Cnuella takakiae TaxID=1302690 RepID=A0A1M4VZ19_9BACT|nr:hypothetical protein [Cnuella takakiae]OLY92459.1 hypothetical protein BUE76_11600 [Cnuella takakiae]SHE74228.1 hypothetical protein SAMN05444008_102431 [Cnuella takakiae]
MRLKPAGILIIVLIIAILGYFALKPRLSEIRSENNTELPGTTGNRSTTAEGTNTTVPEPTTASTGNTDDREFNYTPEKPQNGTLRGVVEVGATGFNSFVINMDTQKRWEIVSKDFGESLAYEGLATTEDIRSGLKKYLAAMFDKGVSKNNMHFVISSGAQKEPKTATISNELKKMGYVVNLVTAEQEARYALQATIPPQFRDNSFLVDIGSGNTKISWEEGGGLKAIELPGAKYYEKGMADDAVYNQVKEQAARIPENKRNVGFILGGVPFTLAKQHRKGEERYTVLRLPAKYEAADKKMASGLNIYKALAAATNTDTFVFDWDANFTIGFLLGLNR